MPRTFPFSYSETLPESTLNRMPDNLAIKGANDPELLLILRLLSGTLELEHINQPKKIRQKDNYFSSNLVGFKQHWDKKFPALIAEDYSAAQLSRFIESVKHENRKFYKNILCELSYFMYHESKGSHTSSFVFLYRALEHVSYAFPLIYASKTNDFLKTYKFLKELMTGDRNAGELGFFKKFLQTVYKDDALAESSIDFTISVETERQRVEIYELLEKLCSAEMIDPATEKPRILSIKYLEVGSFFITVRNRFFHFMSGGAANIETTEIEDVDMMFSVLNKVFLHWLATILLAIVSNSAVNLEKMLPQIEA